MFVKDNRLWKKKEVKYSSDKFEKYIDTLKTFSKCKDTAVYSVTRTLGDIYQQLRFQHALWFELTYLAEDTITINDISFVRGGYYNLLKHITLQEALNSDDLIQHLLYGRIKACNSLLFEDNAPDRLHWLSHYEPFKLNTYIKENFDYLVLSFDSPDAFSKQLVGRVAIQGSGYSGQYKKDGVLTTGSIDGTDVGKFRTAHMQDINDTTLMQTSYSGTEFLISMKDIKSMLSAEDILIRLRAYYSYGDGVPDITVKCVAYRGGDMSLISGEFVNTGGTEVYEDIIGRTVTQWTYGDADGSDCGTVYYDTTTLNGIITTKTPSEIDSNSLLISDIRESGDFKDIMWLMTSDEFDISEYQDMVVGYDFTESIITEYFQEGEEGYTQPNVFTTAEVWDKFLNNYYTAELASPDNIDITAHDLFPVIDGINTEDGYTVLLIGQNIPSENGCYEIKDGKLLKLDIDIEYLTVFVKYGDTLSNKEFYIDTAEDGSVLKDGDDLHFKEGDSFILRNRIKYRLPHTHKFTASSFGLDSKPVTDVNFTAKFYDTPDSYYKVSDDRENFERWENDELIVSEPADGILLPKIIDYNSGIYLVRDNNLVLFNQFRGGEGDIFTTVSTLPVEVADFSYSDNLWYILEKGTGSVLYGTATGSFTQQGVIQSTNIPYEITASKDIVYYLSDEGIGMMSEDGGFIVAEYHNCSMLRIAEFSRNRTGVYFLSDGHAQAYDIYSAGKKYLQMETKEEFVVKTDYSRREIGEWNIISDEGTGFLYYGDTAITSTRSDNLNLPNVTGLEGRMFNGRVYCDLGEDNTSVANLNDGGSFTLEFTVTPDITKPWMPVVYFGRDEKIDVINNAPVKSEPLEYIVFFAEGGNGLPVFEIKADGKKLTVECTEVLQAGKNHISVSVTYTSLKTTAVVYSAGRVIGKESIVSDLDIGNIIFENNYFGKHAFSGYPLFYGELENVRLWGSALNSIQVSVRVSEDIDDTDPLWDTLYGIWKLDDKGQVMYNTRIDPDKETGGGSGWFNGGLSGQEILKDIINVEEIQKEGDSIHILSNWDTRLYTSALDGSDDIFTAVPYNTTSVLGQDAMVIEPYSDYVWELDYKDVKSDTLVRIAAEFHSLVSYPDAFLEIVVVDSLGSEVVSSQNIHFAWQWSDYSIGYYLSNSPGFQSVHFRIRTTGDKVYARNLSLLISHTYESMGEIYKIDTITETVERTVRKEEAIDSIFSWGTSGFYYMWQDEIFPDSSTSSVAQGYGDELFMVGDVFYFRKSDDSRLDIYDSTGYNLYHDSYTFNTDIETVYGITDNGYDIFYVAMTDGSIQVLNKLTVETDIERLFGNNIVFNDDKLNVEINGDIFTAVGTAVYKNGGKIEGNGKMWDYRQEKIWRLRVSYNNLVIATVNIGGKVELWLYNTADNEITHLTAKDQGYEITDFTADMDMSVYEDSVAFFNDSRVKIGKIEGNRFSAQYISPVMYNIFNPSGYSVVTVDHDSDGYGFQALLHNNNEYIVSFIGHGDIFSENSAADVQDYTFEQYGKVCGEFGIFFKDISDDTFNIERHDIDFKVDFSDLEHVIGTYYDKDGWKYQQHTETLYMTAERGNLFKSVDGGQTFTAYNTGISSNLTSIYFIDEESGLITAENGHLLSTFDGGQTFTEVAIPERHKYKNLRDCNIYSEDSGVVVGDDGAVIFIRRSGFVWETVEILYTVGNTDVITDSPLLTITTAEGYDTYRGDILDVDIIGKNKFLMSGDNGTVIYMEVEKKDGIYIPRFFFTKIDIALPFRRVVSYFDPVKGRRTALAVAGNRVYSFEYEVYQTEGINTYTADYTVIHESPSEIRDIDILGDRITIFGEKLNAEEHVLYTFDGEYNTSGMVTQPDTLEGLEPRLLFLDYHAARKVGTYEQDGKRITPTFNIPKSEIECYTFKEGDYLKFYDRGTSDAVNMLAYNDFVMLNRGVIDEPMSWGRIQQPVRKMNKTLTAVSDFSAYENQGVYPVANEAITDISIYDGLQAREDSLCTKIESSDISATVSPDDIIHILSVYNSPEKVLTEGDRVYLKAEVDTVRIYDTFTVGSDGYDLFIENNKFRQYFPVGSSVSDVQHMLISGENAVYNELNRMVLSRGRSPLIVKTLKNTTSLGTAPSPITTKKIAVSDDGFVYYTDGTDKVYIFDKDDNIIANFTAPDASDILYDRRNDSIIVWSSDDTLSPYNITLFSNASKTVIASQSVTDRIFSAAYNDHDRFVYYFSYNKVIIKNGDNLIAEIPDTAGDVLESRYYDGKVYYIKSKKLYSINTDGVITYIPITAIASTADAERIMGFSGNKLYLMGEAVLYGGMLTVRFIVVIDTATSVYLNSYAVQNLNNISKLSENYDISDGDTSFILYAKNYDGVVLFNTDTKDFTDISIAGSSITNIVYDPDNKIFYCFDQNSPEYFIVDPYTASVSEITNNIDSLGQVITSVYSGGKVYIGRYNTGTMIYAAVETIFPDDMNIEFGEVHCETTEVVRAVEGDKISLFSKWNDELCYEMSGKKMITTNLGYFNGDLEHLASIMDKSLLSTVYGIDVYGKESITVYGKEKDTLYYNLECKFEYSADGVIREGYIEYSQESVFSADYNILKILSAADPIFDEDYEFDIPDFDFTFNPSITETGGEKKEFVIRSNRIYVGEDAMQDIVTNIFVDIIGSSAVEKVAVTDITAELYADGKTRYVIHLNKPVENLIEQSGTVILRSRKKLSEISEDLEYTDDSMMPFYDNILTGRKYQFTPPTESYAKVMLKDDNIRKHISAILYTGEDMTYNINVCSITNDPNFYYRPSEVHEIGYDRVLKKAVRVDASNFIFSKDIISLTDIDLTDYSYLLTDGLTVSRLEEEYGWFLNADVYNAVVGEGSDGLVWYTGEWICGRFEEGQWMSGTALSIEWYGGMVYSKKVENEFNIWKVEDSDSIEHTVWYNSIFAADGEFEGIMIDSVFYSGIFGGEFRGGEFRGGVFSGVFSGGEFLDGEFRGVFNTDYSAAVWHNGIFLEGDFENGIWKDGIFDQQKGKVSRFGTKSTFNNNSVWEYGNFRNGTFYSNLDNIDNRYSVFYNGVWTGGTFKGGVIYMIYWENGIFDGGVILELPEITRWGVRTNLKEISGTDIEIEFADNIWLKDTFQNYIAFGGEALEIQGFINENTKALGYDDQPISFAVKEIIDNRTITVNINDDMFPYNISYETGTAVQLTDFNTLLNRSEFMFPSVYRKSLSIERGKLCVTGGVSGTVHVMNIATPNLDYLSYNVSDSYHNVGRVEKAVALSAGYTAVLVSDQNNSDNNYNQYYVHIYDQTGQFVSYNPNPVTAAFDIAADNTKIFVSSNVYPTSLHVYPYNTSKVITGYYTYPVPDSGAGYTEAFMAKSSAVFLNSNLEKFYAVNTWLGSPSFTQASVDGRVTIFETEQPVDSSFYVYAATDTGWFYMINYNSHSVQRSVEVGDISCMYVNPVDQKVVIVSGYDIYTYTAWAYNTEYKATFDTVFSDICYSEYYSSWFAVSGNQIYVLTADFKVSSILYAPKDIVSVTDNGVYLIAETEDTVILYTERDDVWAAPVCADYTQDVIETQDKIDYPISKLYYTDKPQALSVMSDGVIKSGVIQKLFMMGGRCEGGVWESGIIDGGDFL